MQNGLIATLHPFAISGTHPAFICSKLTIETLEKSVKYVKAPDVFIVNVEHILHFVLVFLL